MELGTKIKSLRMKRGITQEKLADELGISFQAVSKWENNITMPDIQLLPKLAVYFGITIDELFELSEEERFTRIENMLEEEKVLSDIQFADTLEFLQRELATDRKSGRVQALLAQLYCHRAESYGDLAADYAKQALTCQPAGPYYKDLHYILAKYENGVFCDWNVDNHAKLIAFYYDMIEKNSAIASSYLYLLDNLLADRRIAEAEDILSTYEKLPDHKPFLIYDYKAKIYDLLGKAKEAQHIRKEMQEKFPEDFLTWFSTADACARSGEYDEAIKYYTKSFDLQPKPRMYDALWSVAMIHEIRKEYAKAATTWHQIIEVIQSEWKIDFGETIDFPKREESRLRSMISLNESIS